MDLLHTRQREKLYYSFIVGFFYRFNQDFINFVYSNELEICIQTFNSILSIFTIVLRGIRLYEIAKKGHSQTH